MNTLSELFAVAGSKRPPDVETLKEAKCFMLRHVRNRGYPQGRFTQAYHSFLNIQMAQMMDDDALVRQSYIDLQLALGEQRPIIVPQT